MTFVKSESEFCTWHELDNAFTYIWRAGCGPEHITQDALMDAPEEMKFCCYCAKKLNLLPMHDLFDEVEL